MVLLRTLSRSRGRRARAIRSEPRTPTSSAAILRLTLDRVAGTNLHVTFIAAGVDPAVGDCVLDRTVVLVRVGAVGKAAAAHVWPQVAVEAGDLFGNDVPEL